LPGADHGLLAFSREKDQGDSRPRAGCYFPCAGNAANRLSQDFLEKNCGLDVAVLDRGLPAKRELEEWLAVKEGKIRVVAGTRSAVFAPVPRLGLIVMTDEETRPINKSLHHFITPVRPFFYGKYMTAVT